MPLQEEKSDRWSQHEVINTVLSQTKKNKPWKLKAFASTCIDCVLEGEKRVLTISATAKSLLAELPFDACHRTESHKYTS